jgi:hypothetical protein
MLSSRNKSLSVCFAAVVALCATVVAAPAAEHNGAVELSGGNDVLQNPTLPKLNLTNAQREQIRRVLLTEPTEVEFRMASTKSAKSFTPSVGAKLPPSIKPMGMPEAVRSQVPQLANYGYAKVKDQVLIVNAMTGKIVDMFSETQPVG